MDPLLLSRVEDASLNASAPPQQLWLDGWLVRLSPGKAKRARSVNAVAAGRLPVEHKLQRARDLYREAGLPMVVRITPFTMPHDLDDRLEASGFGRLDETRVMVRSLQGLRVAPALPESLAWDPADAPAYAEAVGALRGSPEGQRRAHAERLLSSPVPYRGWVLREGGDVVACGQYAREGGLVGIYDVFTAPAWRGRGLARGLCARLLRLAADEGADLAYLQVDAANAPARAVYRRLGFADGYSYHYRAPDGDAG